MEEISFILKLSSTQGDVFQWNTGNAQTEFGHLISFAKFGVTGGNLSHLGGSMGSEI